MRKTLIVVAVAFLLLTGAGGLWYLGTAHHSTSPEQRLSSMWQSVLESEGSRQGDAIQRFEAYRAAQEKQGYFERTELELVHVERGSDTYKAILRQLEDASVRAGWPNFEMVYGDPVRVTIWRTREEDVDELVRRIVALDKQALHSIGSSPDDQAD